MPQERKYQWKIAHEGREKVKKLLTSDRQPCSPFALSLEKFSL